TAPAFHSSDWQLAWRKVCSAREALRRGAARGGVRLRAPGQRASNTSTPCASYFVFAPLRVINHFAASPCPPLATRSPALFQGTRDFDAPDYTRVACVSLCYKFS